MKIWTADDDEKLLALEAQGMTRVQIAGLLGATKGMICGRLYRLKHRNPAMPLKLLPYHAPAGLLTYQPVIADAIVMPPNDSMMDRYRWNRDPANRYGSSWYMNRGGTPPPGDDNWAWNEQARRWIRPKAEDDCRHSSKYLCGGHILVCQYCEAIAHR